MRRWGAGLGATGLVAAAGWALYGRVPLSYDSYFALLWGSDLAHGRTPQYELALAPTPHPLYNVVGAALSPLGHGAETGLEIVVLLALGAAAVALFRIGSELGGTAAGALAAAILVTRAPVLEFAGRASVDVPAMALLLWATALELRRPRRGASVMVLLGLAGLLRPEAWVLAAAYWLWLWPALDRRGRLLLAALAAAAPAIWLGTDLLVTGDALWSSHHTAVKVRDARDITGFEALGRVPRQVGSILRIPALIAAAAGIALAAALRLRRTALPGALLVLSGVAALALAVGDQTILQRFFFFPAGLLAAFAALAALGWAGRGLGGKAGGGRWAVLARRGSRLLGLVLCAGLIAGAPSDVDRIADSRAALRADERFQAPLRELAQEPAVRRALHECQPAYVRAGGVIGTLSLFSDSRPSVFAGGALPAPHGSIVATAPGLRVKDLAAPIPPPVAVPPGYRPVVGNAYWRVLRACG